MVSVQGSGDGGVELLTFIPGTVDGTGAVSNLHWIAHPSSAGNTERMEGVWVLQSGKEASYIGVGQQNESWCR